MKPGHVKQRHLPVLQLGPPTTRADCRDAPRPCHRIFCRHHTWRLDNIDRRGNGSYSVSAREVAGVDFVRDPQPESCSLDVAERGGELEVDEIARINNMSRRQVQRVIRRGLRKLKRATVARSRSTRAA